MEDGDNESGLYKVGEPKSNKHSNEETILRLSKPVFRATKPKFPEYMSFAAIGSRIFMVGGNSYGDEGDIVVSNKVFIYDTSSSKCESGPPLNSGKQCPHLFTLGSKLFALSNRLDFWAGDELIPENLPRFEMLDTDHLTRGWSPLPHPPLDCSDEAYGRFAVAAVDIGCGVIFASVGRSGIWAFELDKRVWVCVDANRDLPFSGHATSIPHAPSLCCGYSFKSGQYCSFRFSYQSVENNKHEFKVDIFEIDVSYCDAELGQSLAYCKSLPTVFGPDGRVYFVSSGVHIAGSYHSAGVNRYVKIYALEFCNRKLEVSNSPKKKKAKLEISEMSDSTLSFCGPMMRSCSTNEKRLMEEEGNEVENLKFRGIWRRCFSGGVAFDPYLQVIAAFAM